RRAGMFRARPAGSPGLALEPPRTPELFLADARSQSCVLPTKIWEPGSRSPPAADLQSAHHPSRANFVPGPEFGRTTLPTDLRQVLERQELSHLLGRYWLQVTGYCY